MCSYFQHCLPDCEETHYKASVSAAPFCGCDFKNFGTSPLCNFESMTMPPMWGASVIEQYREGEIRFQIWVWFWWVLWFQLFRSEGGVPDYLTTEVPDNRRHFTKGHVSIRKFESGGLNLISNRFFFIYLFDNMTSYAYIYCRKIQHCSQHQLTWTRLTTPLRETLL